MKDLLGVIVGIGIAIIEAWVLCEACIRTEGDIHILLIVGIIIIITLAVFVAEIIMLFVKRNKYWGGLLAAWLLFSPLVLLSGIRKNTYKKWWIIIPLIIFSPITVAFDNIVLYMCAIASYDCYSPEEQEMYRNFMEEHYSNAEVFEESTDVKLPQFQVTEYNHCWSNFRGEFDDSMTIEFDTPLSDEFYQYLDSLVEYNDHWVKSTPDDEWSMGFKIVINDSVMYKGGTCINDYMKMHIQKGETWATISYGNT